MEENRVEHDGSMDDHALHLVDSLNFVGVPRTPPKNARRDRLFHGANGGRSSLLFYRRIEQIA
jgi:hypothetical protein